MQSKRWFWLYEGRVSGPFMVDEIVEIASKAVKRDEGMVWCRGHKEWSQYKDWDPKNADRVPAQQGARTEWYLKLDLREDGPMSYEDAVKALTGRPEVAIKRTKVRTSVFPDWLDVFQFANLVEDVGLPRTSPRARIKGEFEIRNGRSAFQAKAMDVSETGVGLECETALPTGVELQIFLKSPNFSRPVSFTARVIYQNADGKAGLRIQTIAPEIRTAIAEYVRRYLIVKAGGNISNAA